MRERYGIEPAQVPDFIALRGDPSDGLPGAPGIGAKTAAELLRGHGSLEQVLSVAAAVDGPSDRGDDAPAPPPRCARTSELLRDLQARSQPFSAIDVDRPHRPRHRLSPRGAECRQWLGMEQLATRLATSGRAGQARYGVNLTVITSPSAIA